ncbi:hypothetical protein [Knoellia subterranea]|uniref:Uncharacterized protein n=1 Tax=Knoellia subterranea KCTC 19937 TaxID=1385521 RepID=A0A0A0JQV2_9MICO|nr:hypothetical protein [Knoellia subterranea]KGN39538.1 hypothetical protein N803_00075 [Knoellia subterranea KCTC 19937]
MPDSDVSDVGFAEFVAVLLVETLDSIVASHASQEDRLRALDAAADLTPEEVAATSITAGMVDLTLVELFPDGKGGTTVAVDGPVPPPESLADLGVDLPSRDGRLTSKDVGALRNAVALLLARRHLESVQEVRRRGVPRVLVDGGTLRAKLAFSTTRATTPAPTPARAATPGLTPAASRTALSTIPISRIGDLIGPRATVLRPEVLDGIRDLRLRVRPPAQTTEPGEPAEKADVFGEIEIRFRTEL